MEQDVWERVIAQELHQNFSETPKTKKNSVEFNILFAAILARKQ
jgi:hypothetical protein